MEKTRLLLLTHLSLTDLCLAPLCQDPSPRPDHHSTLASKPQSMVASISFQAVCVPDYLVLDAYNVLPAPPPVQLSLARLLLLLFTHRFYSARSWAGPPSSSPQANKRTRTYSFTRDFRSLLSTIRRRFL